MRTVGDHAVVLGGGVAGLLAARVLADAYDRVTVIERDLLPAAGEHRQGVPQGRHAHVLLPRGGQVLDELFPGLTSDLAAEDIPVLDDLAQLHLSVGGHLFCREPRRGGPAYLPSRPHLEGRIRTRVWALWGVEILHGCDVVGLVTTQAGARVSGVRVVRRADDNAEMTLDADLVVDALGPGSRTPAWLRECGYEPAPEERVPIQVMYASQPVRLRPGTVPEKLVLVGPRPGRPTGMTVVAHGKDEWLFSVHGYRGHHPPSDRDGMLAVGADLAPRHVVAGLRAAEPLAAVATYRFPATQRRRYEKLDRLPDGLLALGDGICALNPIYGQGISVAALEALTLRECLRQGPHGLSRRFFHAAAKHISAAWRLGLAADLALPEVGGQLPAALRPVHAYVGRLQAVAENDPLLADQFLRVSGLLDRPRRLLRPATALRTLTGRPRRRYSHRYSPPAPATGSTSLPTITEVRD